MYDSFQKKDADLVMLSLMTYEQNIYLVREDNTTEQAALDSMFFHTRYFIHLSF